MAGQNTIDPMEIWKKIYDETEKQWSETFNQWSNNKEYVQFSRMGLEAHAQFIETFRDNRKRWLEQLDLPSRKDLANISKLTIQVEEKVDALEEQVWGISDSVLQLGEEVNKISKVSKELSQMTKQLKQNVDELKNAIRDTKKQDDQMGELKTEVGELKFAIAELVRLQKEEKTEAMQANILETV